MNAILDMIVGNTFIFVGILIFLGVTLVVLIVSIVKGNQKQHKIPIYEEDLEDEELKSTVKDVLDKPEVRETKKRISLEEAIEEKEEEDSEENLFAFEDIGDSSEELEENSDVEESEEEKLAELEKIDEEEIKERIDKEHEEDIEETMEEIDNQEMTELLQNLKNAKEMKPEDVVRQFEQEQEAQSIISYQELLDVVKNRDNQFEDELESKPLATVSDFLPEGKKESVPQNQKVVELIQELEKPKTSEESIEEQESIPDEALEEMEFTKEEETELEDLSNDQDSEEDLQSVRKMVRETLKEIPEDGKFKKTELISPVFGRIEEKTEDSYPTVKKFSREKEETLEEFELPVSKKSGSIKDRATKNNLFEDISEKVGEEDTATALFEEIPVDTDIKTTEKGKVRVGNISKNEEFLKALKNFRDSL